MAFVSYSIAQGMEALCTHTAVHRPGLALSGLKISALLAGCAFLHSAKFSPRRILPTLGIQILLGRGRLGLSMPGSQSLIVISPPRASMGQGNGYLGKMDGFHHLGTDASLSHSHRVQEKQGDLDGIFF